MQDFRDRRIAREALEQAVWQCREAGISEENAMKIIEDEYRHVASEADNG